MHSKKSIELSLNFIIVIIISITIFGFGVLFISRLSSSATDLTKLTTSQLDEQISNIACGGYERVCISPEKKEIQREKFGVFGIKLFNIKSTENFEISIIPSTALNKNGLPITNSLTIKPHSRQVDIKQNEEKIVGIGIGVPSNAPSGTYTFDVNIKNNNEKYVPVQKLVVDVP